MSKWEGCPVISCKNQLCDFECQHQKARKAEAIFEAALGMTPEEWKREKEIAKGLNALTQ